MSNIRPYRGKWRLGGTWVYGWYTQWTELDRSICCIYTDNHKPFEVIHETVGQSTGLKDKHRVEIFEGDIVKQTYRAERGNVYDGTDETYEGHHIGAIVLGARGATIKNPLHYSADTNETSRTSMRKQVAGYRCEVIGNIHDNPELLEGGQ